MQTLFNQLLAIFLLFLLQFCFKNTCRNGKSFVVLLKL